MTNSGNRMIKFRIVILLFMPYVVSGWTFYKEDLTHVNIFKNQLKYTQISTTPRHHESLFRERSIKNRHKFEKNAKYKYICTFNSRQFSTKKESLYRKTEKMARTQNASYLYKQYHVQSTIHYRYMTPDSTKHDNHVLHTLDWSCQSNETSGCHTVKKKLKPPSLELSGTEETDIPKMIRFISYNSTGFTSELFKEKSLFNIQHSFYHSEDANQANYMSRSLKVKKTVIFCSKNTLDSQIPLLCNIEVIESFCHTWTYIDTTTSLQIYWKLPWENHHATTSDSIDKEILREQHKLFRLNPQHPYHTFEFNFKDTAYIIQITLYLVIVFTFQSGYAKSSLIFLASLLMLDAYILPIPGRRKKHHHITKHSFRIRAKGIQTNENILSSFMPYFPSKHRRKLNLKNSTFLTWIGTTQILNSLKQCVSRVYYTQGKNKSFSRRKQLRCPRKYVRRKNGPFVFGKQMKKHRTLSKSNRSYTIIESLFAGFLTAWKEAQHHEKIIFDSKKEINLKKDNRLSGLYKSPQSFIFPHTNAFVYPVFRSLDQYFSATKSSTDNSQSAISIQESLGLEIELLRVSTYSSFPNSNAPSSLALAKAGFFYTQNNDTVECFQCHIQCSNWSKHDNPSELHKRMSPSCEFIRGQPTSNVPVNRPECNVGENTNDTVKHRGFPRSENKKACSTIPDNSNHNSHQRACRSSDIAAVSSSQPTTQRRNESKPPNVVQHCNATGRDRLSSSSTETSRSPDNKCRPRPHPKATVSNSHPSHRQTIEPSIPVLQLEPLGICQARPRYPAYAVLSVRMSTYQGWPPTAGQSPRLMATAGFIFAGYGDYTRCFFCGGGLRNWEPEDDPWIEHAKWFPKCVYVRQNKGDNFVQLVHQNLDGKMTQSSEQLTVPTVNEQSVTRSRQQSNSQLNVQDPSVQSVHEMGYSVEIITQAINTLKIERRRVDAQNILETIFTMEETKPVSKNEGYTQIEENYNEHAGAKSNAMSKNVEASVEQVDISEYLSLVAENRSLKEQRNCKICLDNEATIAFVPCGHISCCPECAVALRKCPICRNTVNGTIKTYLA